MKYSLAILTAFALLPMAGRAQDAGPADAADPGSAVPPYSYESAFQRYAPHRDAEISDWRSTAFEQQAPGRDAMGHRRMPAQSPPQKGSGEASSRGMHPMHKMQESK
jgi:hypothetical protein